MNEAPRYPGRLDAFLNGQISFEELHIALLDELRQSPERRSGCAAFLDDLVGSGRLTMQLRAALLHPVLEEGSHLRHAARANPPPGSLADLLRGAPPANAVSMAESTPDEDVTVPLDTPRASAATAPRLETPLPRPPDAAAEDAVPRSLAGEIDDAFLNDYLKAFSASRSPRTPNRAEDQRLDGLLADWRGARFRREAHRLAAGTEPARPLHAAQAPGDPPRRINVGAIVKDRFVIESLLGRGGMGRVFRAVDRRMLEAENPSPYVALKVLNDDFAQRPQAFQALEREARKAQSLNHPNIINVFDVDRDGRTVYVVMEWLSGAPLSTVLRARGGAGLRPEQATPIIEGMCAALAHAHANGIVHSDFKPANIFVCDDGAVKVLDFGIARATRGRPGKGPADRFDIATLGGMTPAYASPEIMENGSADARDDIYALGCVVYLMLNGDHPFARKSSLVARNERLEAAPIPGLGPRAMAAIRQALEFQRERRTPSVAAFREAYLAGLEGNEV